MSDTEPASTSPQAVQNSAFTAGDGNSTMLDADPSSAHPKAAGTNAAAADGQLGPSRSVVLNDVAEADEDDEVHGGGCFCFGGGGGKKEKSPAAENGKREKKKKKNPKKKKGFDDEGSFRNRKMSVAALSDSNQLIELTEAEQEEVKAAQAKVDSAFELDELNGLYADYKMNGKEITQSDFHIIFATFSRSGDAAMADVVFGMIDSTDSGSLGFAAFVDVLAIMTRGTPDEKMEFCYKMIDTDGDGQLTHKELVGLLKYLPMKRLQKQNNALNRISAFQPGGGAMMEGLQEEDEEAAEATAAAEVAAAAELAAAAEPDTDDSARTRMASTKTTDHGRTKTLGRRRQEASDNQRIAFEVVDEAYEALDKDTSESLSLEEFKLLSQLPSVAQYFMPFVFQEGMG